MRIKDDNSQWECVNGGFSFFVGQPTSHTQLLRIYCSFLFHCCCGGEKNKKKLISISIFDSNVFDYDHTPTFMTLLKHDHSGILSLDRECKKKKKRQTKEE